MEVLESEALRLEPEHEQLLEVVPEVHVPHHVQLQNDPTHEVEPLPLPERVTSLSRLRRPISCGKGTRRWYYDFHHCDPTPGRYTFLDTVYEIHDVETNRG